MITIEPTYYEVQKEDRSLRGFPTLAEAVKYLQEVNGTSIHVIDVISPEEWEAVNRLNAPHNPDRLIANSDGLTYSVPHLTPQDYRATFGLAWPRIVDIVLTRSKPTGVKATRFGRDDEPTIEPVEGTYPRLQIASYDPDWNIFLYDNDTLELELTHDNGAGKTIINF
jgi:hypothetical protein